MGEELLEPLVGFVERCEDFGEGDAVAFVIEPVVPPATADCVLLYFVGHVDLLLQEEGRLRALPLCCFWLSRLCSGLHLGRKRRVAFAVDEEAVTGALLVGEGGADALVFLLAAVFDGVEDVEGRYLFLFGRFGLCCHGLSPFSCLNKSP